MDDHAIMLLKCIGRFLDLQREALACVDLTGPTLWTAWQLNEDARSTLIAALNQIETGSTLGDTPRWEPHTPSHFLTPLPPSSR
jgi:hypothetical protein